MVFPTVAYCTTQCIYIAVCLLAVYSFGSSLLETSNVLDSVSKLDTWESYVLRGFYLVISAAHIPFIFYPGKEAGLVLLAELKDGSISKMREKAQEQAETELMLSEKLIAEGGEAERVFEPKNPTVRSQEAYKLVSPTLYYTFTFICYALEIVVAIYLEDIEVVSALLPCSTQFASRLSIIAFWIHRRNRRRTHLLHPARSVFPRGR